jgi:hypothetical protein
MAVKYVKILIEIVNSGIRPSTLAEEQGLAEGLRDAEACKKLAGMCRDGQRWEKRKIERDQKVEGRRKELNWEETMQNCKVDMIRVHTNT